MPVGKRNIINIPAGVNKEDNAFTSLIYTDANKMRFHNGLPEKIGGWYSINYTNSQTLNGVPRTIFSYLSNNGTEHVLIGTHTRLYSYESGNLYNITPLVTGTTAIANSLATNYGTLGTDPVTVTISTRLVTLTYSPFTQAIFEVGDRISISGVGAAIGGIPAAEINGAHQITVVTATTLSFVVTTAATSTASGGGAAVVLATRVINVSQLAHGFLDGDRIALAAAADFGGFTAATDVNRENVIRNVSANAYSVYLSQTTNYATSSVTAAGGAATTVRGQIAAGNCTFRQSSGYGGGLYGAGLYGVPKLFISGYTLPRIWSIDLFGETAVLTAGNQTGVYQWLNNIDTAPTLISGAPAAVNYLFVAANQIVTFGAGNVPNFIKTSDTADATNWTIDATSSAFEVALLDTGRLIAHGYVKDQYLLFSQDAVYTMQFVGKPNIWFVKKLYGADGVLSPKSVVQLPDAVAWAGQNDFYIYNGSQLSSLPRNTLLHWFQDEMNWGKYYLSFSRRVLEFNEVWWFYPSRDNEEPDSYIIWNFEEGHFTNGFLNRTASEEPANPVREQYMANGACDGETTTVLYQHERDYSDDNAPMQGYLATNYTLIGEGDYIQNISRIIPSNVLLPSNSTTTETLYTILVNTKNYDSDANPRLFGAYSVLTSTQKIDTRILGRQRQYVYNFSNTCGFRIQKSYEESRPFTPR
jgi:hypothetical protein